ncbi:MAG: IPT/TIG domain-containing protein, partial [Dysgonamonadaceae bacterium]|nr:IPT/TIG domain-containing protein [Dysgonamonadaceae bacterium]
TYKWFASKNDGAYEYLGITTTPSYTEIFPAGNGRMKVIMDDCRSVKESEASFNMGSVSPNFGSQDGGNYVYIYGDFPYAATSEYAAQENLVAHFDGINNQGLGDKQHDYSKAASWKDLKNNFELPRGSGDGKWLSNGFLALDEYDSFYSTATYPNTYPLGNQARTVEVIFRTPDESNMFWQIEGTQRRIFAYGKEATPQLFGVQYRGLRTGDLNLQDVCSTENKWVFYAILGYNYNLITCLSSTPSLETHSTINTVTSTYQNDMQDALTKSYINNIPATIAGIYNPHNHTSLNTQQGFLLIGRELAHSTFLSVRLYNRVLKPEEIAENAALDQIRYLAPPTVTIGEAECEEVVVLSPHFLMCKVPAGSIGATDIEIKVKDKGTEKTINYAGAYEYVDPVGNFYISEISPIVSPVEGGGTLTLKGNLLSTINEVSIGNVVCSNVTIQGDDTYTCSIPANPAGEVDITITVGTGENAKIYRFAKVFEYQ